MTAGLVSHFLNTVDAIATPLGLSVPPIASMETLRQLPSDTLGGALVHFLDRHQLTLFTTGPRRKQLHDVIHVLTGYGTDGINELEVQAFLLGIKLNPFNLLIGTGLLRVTHSQGTRFPLWNADVRQRLWIAYQRGRASNLDIDRWDPQEYWALPLSQVRQMLSIQECNLQ